VPKTFECPYCGEQAATGDHIFPQFMGGKREIPSCKRCNDRFGGTFEALASELFNKLHVYLAGQGVPLNVPVRRWRRAFEIKGEPYDISVVDGKMRFLLSEPVVDIDPETRVLNARFGSRKQAKGVLASLKRKHGIDAPLDLEITPAVMPNVEIKLGWEVLRLSLKMSSALASRLPGFRSRTLPRAGSKNEIRRQCNLRLSVTRSTRRIEGTLITRNLC
jgi:hypothetical protein